MKCNFFGMTIIPIHNFSQTPICTHIEYQYLSLEKNLGR